MKFTISDQPQPIDSLLPNCIGDLFTNLDHRRPECSPSGLVSLQQRCTQPAFAHQTLTFYFRLSLLSLHPNPAKRPSAPSFRPFGRRCSSIANVLRKERETSWLNVWANCVSWIQRICCLICKGLSCRTVR